MGVWAHGATLVQKRIKKTYATANFHLTITCQNPVEAPDNLLQGFTWVPKVLRLDATGWSALTQAERQFPSGFNNLQDGLLKIGAFRLRNRPG